MEFSNAPRGPARTAFLIKLTISSVLLGFLFWRVDRSAFLRSLQSLPVPLLLGCAGLYILGYIISIIRWQRLLRAEGIELGLWRVGLVYFQGAFFNLFLPTLIGGDIVRGYFIYKLTRGHDASVASILVDRLTGFAALILLSLTALTFAYRTLNDPQVVFGVLAIAACFAGVLCVVLNRWLTTRVSGVLAIIGLARFQAKLQGLVDALQRYRRHHRALAQAFVLSALLQALIIVTYYLIGVGLNLGVPLLYFFLFVPLITAIAMLPVSVAGLGVREGGVIYFFGKLGVDAATALGMSLVWFSLTLVVSSLGGLAFLIDAHTAKRAEDA
jgi:glycosyltransferase 2 family protein